VIALIVFGPKKLLEVAKTVGRAIGELKQTTEDVNESIGIELEDIRSNLAGKVSRSMVKETIGEALMPAKDSIRERTFPFPRDLNPN
jgi:TatA/E family protein of Tat protein translocase